MNSDYQACSSDNFAIIEDPRSRSECDTDHSHTDGEDITLSPPKPKVSKSCWEQQLTRQSLILSGQSSILSSLQCLVTHIGTDI